MSNHELITAADNSLAQLYRMMSTDSWATLTDKERLKLFSRAKTLMAVGHALIQKIEPGYAPDQNAEEELDALCANCGCPEVTIVNGNSLYDGEGVCSKACLDEHDDLGCPLEHGPSYRPCPH